MNQSILRKRLIQRRNNFTTDYQQSASEQVVNSILRSQEYQQAKTIAAYLAIGKEIDLSSLIAHALQQQKTVYLPRINQQSLDFVQYTHSKELIPNAFNILEPPSSNPAIDIKDINLIYMPLVGFDNQLNRIGMGGGYYDRTLASVKSLKQPIRIGVAYKEQALDSCHTNPWDIPFHQVISNT